MQPQTASSKRFRLIAAGILVALVTSLFITPVEGSADLSGPSLKQQQRNVIASSQAGTETVLAVLAQYALEAADSSPLDEFGYAVALDGNTAVVGARNADPNPGSGTVSNAGAAYVYVRAGDTWQQQAKLIAKDAEPGDSFGVSVAISGNFIVVGATGADIDEAEDSGAAYVFRRVGATWEQQARLEPDDPVEDDSFGSAVAIDRDKIVIGAPSRDMDPLIDVGTAYIFIWSGGKIWSQKAKLLPFSPEFGDFFGSAVAVSGNTVAVGATETNPYTGRGSGEVYLYTGSGSSWVPHSRLRPEGARKGDAFGGALALVDETLVVGAQFADPESNFGRITSGGAAYIFTRNGSSWSEEAALVAKDAAIFDHFGQSVAVSGKTVLIGADGKTQAGEDSAGAVYVFQKQAGEWRQQTKTVTDPAFEDDNFGNSVAVVGDWAVVGAVGRDPSGKTQAGEIFLIRLGAALLPDTGFTPGQMTALPAQPAGSAYQAYDELRLEIPRLAVDIPIVGVSRGPGGWDVRWLWDQAGYLVDTAFPTWRGNTGLAAHATLPDGQPGPFAGLDALKWGDTIVVHAWGQRYIYSVRSTQSVSSTDLSVLDHENMDWVTLITCESYDPRQAGYELRRVVRAVLVRVEAD